MQELTLFDHQPNQNSPNFLVSASHQMNYMTTLTPSLNGTNNNNENNQWLTIPSPAKPFQQQFFPEMYSMSSSMESIQVYDHNTSSESESKFIQNQTCETHPTNHHHYHHQQFKEENQNSNNTKTGLKKKKSGKSTYKHVPHREKPVHLVARRNARERRRVQAVNSAFARLRKSVPFENRNKRLSKVKTLHRAIEYIAALQDLLRDADEQDGIIGDESLDSQIIDHRLMVNGCAKIESIEQNKYNKENQIEDQKWVPNQMDCNHSYINGFNCNYRYLKCLP